jgi:plastocyanin
MKKLFVILMILFVGILLCGCTSKPAAPATPAATAVPTTVAPVETTAAPTVVPTTVAPVVVNTTATPKPTATPIPDQKIKVDKTLTFIPKTITVPVGTKVIFSTDAVGYKFKVGVTGLGVNAVSDIISTASTWSYTFTKAGTYTLSEQITPQFHDIGTIIVT